MPRSLLSLSLSLMLFLVSFPTVFAQDIAPLTNSDIVTMVRAKLPPALIIEKINTSSCSFDTFPSVLAELKYKGVPDEVLMAMVKAPHGAPAATRNSAGPVPAPPSPTARSDRDAPRSAQSAATATSADSASSVTPNVPAKRNSPSASISNPRHLKEIKICGYITEFNSPTSFEIEDYRITRDESVVFEFENQI